MSTKIMSKKPFRLREMQVIRGNLYHPQVYLPGELPPDLYSEKYGEFIDDGTSDEAIDPVLSPVITSIDDGARVENELALEDLVDINTATIDDLIKVDRIGNSTATKIVAERNNGKFADVDDLMRRMPALINSKTVFERNFKFG
jgi:hypothetical protein